MAEPRLTVELDVAEMTSARLRALSLRWLDRAVREFCFKALDEIGYRDDAARVRALGALSERTLGTADTILHSALGRIQKESLNEASAAFAACIKNTREGLYAARQRVLPAPPRAPPTKNELVFAKAVSVAVILAAARLARADAARAGKDPSTAEEAAAAAEKLTQERDVFTSTADA